MFRKFGFISPPITILVIVFLANTLSQAEPLPLLTRHVREAVVNSQAPLIGQLPATQAIHFDVVLALRDRAGLQTFVIYVYRVGTRKNSIFSINRGTGIS